MIKYNGVSLKLTSDDLIIWMYLIPIQYLPHVTMQQLLAE